MLDVQPNLKFLPRNLNVTLRQGLLVSWGGGGGGGPTTKKTKDILRFCRRHDLFCSFLFFNYKDISLVNTDIYCLTTHLYRNFVMQTIILSVYKALANIVPRIFE